MSWCEDNEVFYCFGLARNDRLSEQLQGSFEDLQSQIKEGKLQSPCRSFTEFEYSTLKTWSKGRRVIGKAEILPKGDNPRFIVTNLRAPKSRGSSRLAIWLLRLWLRPEFWIGSRLAGPAPRWN
jgi:Transposase DDE domain group 1